MNSQPVPQASHSSSQSLVKAAVRPVPLLLLAAGAAAGFAFSWAFAGAGAVAFCVAVALGRPKSQGGPDRLPPPVLPQVAIRSTGVLAYVVRIRKGYEATWQVLSTATPSVRSLLASSYERLGPLVQHAFDLAKRADGLRAHLDRPPTARTLQDQLTAAQARADAPGEDDRSLEATLRSLQDQLDARRRLEEQYDQITEMLQEICASLEGWQARVMHMNVEALADAERETHDVEAGLDRMEQHVRALEEVTRLEALR